MEASTAQPCFQAFAFRFEIREECERFYESNDVAQLKTEAPTIGSAKKAFDPQ